MITFAQKYTPHTFEEMIFPDSNTRQRILEFAQNKRHGSLLLHGPYGTAKSTTARLVAKMRANGAQYGGDDFYRAHDITAESFGRISNTQTVQRLAGVIMPLSIIDEIDQVDSKLQYRLRWELDLRADRGCFLFTTNKLYHVDPGLIDRCDVIELPAANTDHWFERARWILEKEGVSVSDAKLSAVLSTCDGSIRDLMRALEDLVLRHPRAA